VVGDLPDLTQEQRADFKRILTNITRSNPPPFVLHHGYSQGSDEVVHEIVRTLGGWQIHGHPGHDDRGPVPRSKGDLDVIHDSKPRAERNAEIADASRILVVIPPDREDGPEADQPGLWTTIHKARATGRTIFYLAQPGRRKKNRSRNETRTQEIGPADVGGRDPTWAKRQGKADRQDGTACRKYYQFLKKYELPECEFTLTMWASYKPPKKPANSKAPRKRSERAYPQVAYSSQAPLPDHINELLRQVNPPEAIRDSWR
jgi:hypothetical protein